MPRTYTYPTIVYKNTKPRGPGVSDSGTLSEMFGTPPGLAEYLENPPKYKKDSLNRLVVGEVDGMASGKVDRDFGANATSIDRKPPDFDAIKAEIAAAPGAGAPASPWVPNPVSPGEGSSNPLDQGPHPEGYGLAPTTDMSSNPGSQDSLSPSRNPANSSFGMSQTDDGAYDSGKSPATANAT